MKVIIVTNIPNHYRIPLFNALHLQLKDEGIQLKVIFGAAGYAFRKHKIDLSNCQFEYEILKEKGNKNANISYSGLYQKLKREEPSKIVVSGFNLGTLKCFMYAWRFSKPLIIWSGSVEIGNRKTPWYKKTFRKLMIRQATGLIAYGSLAKLNMIKLGAQPQDVTAIGNTVDTGFFEKEVQKLRSQNKEEKKVKSLLYLGYLTPLKNLYPLIDLIEQLSLQREDFVLDIVGDGECREELEKEVEQRKMSRFVVFHGFKQKAEVPYYLAKADVFLFQTEADIWGLVLNEAMVSALPSLVSKRAGAAIDLIKEGETGFVVDFHEIDNVLEKLNWLLDHPIEAKRIGENAAELIKREYSMDAVAKRFKDALTG